MTITPEVRKQFFADTAQGATELIRLPPAPVTVVGPNRRLGVPWTQDEHDRFLQGLEMFPKGPWRCIAAHVATRTTRQTMTHAQKYRQRIARQSTLAPPTAASKDQVDVHPPREAGSEQCDFSQLNDEDVECLARMLLDTDDSDGGNAANCDDSMLMEIAACTTDEIMQLLDALDPLSAAFSEETDIDNDFKANVALPINWNE